MRQIARRAPAPVPPSPKIEQGAVLHRQFVVHSTADTNYFVLTIG